MVKKSKNGYFYRKLDIKNAEKEVNLEKGEGSRKMWQTAKSLAGKASIQPPRKIIFEGKIITSLKTISGLINEFYIQK